MSFIQKSFLSIGLLLLSMIFFNNKADASHVAGGYIHYECISPGEYRISLVLYRDCSGINLNTYAKSISYSNSCGLSNPNVRLDFESMQEVSQVCLNDQNNTTCQGGNIHGYEEWVYSAIVHLDECDGWTLSYNLNARNATVNVQNSNTSDFHVTTVMNTATAPCNTSPVTTSQPEPYVCKGQPMSYNLGGYEPNGDHIEYELVPAVNSSNNNMTYNWPFSGNEPITGATIDPLSGTVTFTPTQNGAFIFVIQMTEYDASGNIISQTKYEYQTFVMDCSNEQPTVGGSGGGGVQNPSGSIIQLGPNSLKLCRGLEGCFDIIFVDANPSDVISYTSNITNVLPGADITTSGSNPLTLHVCWTPPASTLPGIVTLNFLIEDDACPITGQNNYAATIEVIEPGVVSIAKTVEDCLGDDEGRAVFTVTGGSSPTTYDITGPVDLQNTTGNFYPLPPGDYNYIIATSGGGCPLTGTFNIAPGAPLNLTGSSIEANCFEEENGSATVDPAGSAPYSYVWTGGNAAGQTTQTASGLGQGSYDVEVTDGNGCKNTTTIVVGEPTELVGSLAPTHINCNGDATGAIDVTGVSGGTPSYEYNIDGGTYGSNTNFISLGEGNHVVKVKDDHGCILELNVVLTEPTPLVLVEEDAVDATCGDDSGGITVSATGGNGAYTFSDGVTTNTDGVFTDLAPGPHNITVTDENGCTDQLSISVGAVGAPVVSIDSQDNLQCYGGNNGKVVIDVSGAVGDVYFTLDGGTPQTSNVFSNLTEGSYTIEIVDDNNCVAQTVVTITQPDILSFTSTPQGTSCGGECDGEIAISATGGTGAYHYSSDNGGTFTTTSPLDGLCVGDVYVVVKDDNGCLANSTVVIGEPGELIADFVNTDPTCRDGDDGSIEVNNITGGTPGTPPAPAFEYSVDGGSFQTGNILTGLTSGPHDVIVRDGNGCELTTVQTLGNPPGIDIIEDFMNPSNCGFADGEISVHGVGVNSPFEYAIGGASTPSGPTGPTSYQSTGLFQNQLAGAYLIYVRDTEGCIDSTFVGINDVEMDGELVSSTDLTCFESGDGQVEVNNIGGGLPISFELDNSGTVQTNNGNFNGLDAGHHIVIIYDAGNCVYTVPFDLTQPDIIDFDADIIDVACNSGATGEIAIIDTIGGNGNFTFSIDYGFNFQTGPFTGLAEGDYDLMVFDEDFCSAMKSFHIDQADPIEFTANVTDLICHNDGSGEIMVVGQTGGTGSYQYSIDGGTYQPSPIFSGLDAGTYTLTVEDVNVSGCEISMDTIVYQPDTVQAVYTPTGTTCFEDCDGEIEVVAQGGTPNYLYSADGVIFSSNPILDDLCAGSYTVIVEDANGCTIESTIQDIIEPDKVIFESDSIVSTCSDANGEINITSVSGGTPGPGYTYSIDSDPFGNDDNFSGLLAGTYTISVMDSRGCLATGTQKVTDEPSPVINILDGTDPSCFGDANGSVEVTASGGKGVLSYSVDGGAPQAGIVLTGLTAGLHTVTIEDENGCTDSKDITLDEPDVLAFTSTADDLTCFENSTGKVHAVPTGGTPSYQYSFDNGVTFGSSPSNNFIPAGTYTIIVKDAHDCEVTGTQIVTEPTELVFDAVDVTDAICKSDCNGTIQLSVSGGTGAPIYTWLEGVAGDVDIATGLCTGTYTFMVEDQNGCVIDSLGFIDEPGSVEITNLVKTNVNCHGDCDGTIEVTSPTATEYSIDNGASFQPANAFTNLCDGDYDIVARDADGCIVKDAVNIWQPDPMSLTMPNDTTVCYAYNLEVTADATGGIQPYTYAWTNTTSTDDTLEVIVTSTETYTLNVFDYKGCTVPAGSVTISVLPQVGITVLNDTTICPDGTAILTAEGSDGLPNYTYEWNTGETTSSISVSPNSTTVYTATVTDQCGDEATNDVTVDLHDLPTVLFEADTLTGCIPQEVHFTNTTDPSEVGGNCLWTVNGETFPGCSGLDYTFNSAFCYDVSLQVTSPDGCVNDTTFADYICIDDYPVAEFYFDPTHPTPVNNLVNFTNYSIGADTYNWSFPGQGSSSEVNPSITYSDVKGESIVSACLEAISQYGCIDKICKEIEFRDEFVVFVPNTFTPDEDQYNPTFLPVFPPNSDFKDYHMTIFNRWGEILFESYDPNVGWNGTYGINSTTPVKDGTYIWKITLKQSDEHDGKEFVGHVTLLR